MANEAVTIETPTEFAVYTVADGTAIPLNTLMQLSGDFTITASSGKDVWGGVQWEEKTISDGITRCTVALNGVHDLTCAASAVTLGSQVCLSGANLIRVAIAADLLLGKVIGKAEEAGSAGDIVRVRVGAT